ncbi:MAG: sulfur carrier protein ThiS [Candidatus Hydrogenedentota bacterium]|nr:MAG: sulfur carrier protein ThiS [Candidatus Hydrogenedentota bacterium]
MQIRLNGEPHESFEAITVADLLRSLGIQEGRVAVELNLTILPKEEYATTTLREGDQLEVVHFVGGGTS